MCESNSMVSARIRAPITAFIHLPIPAQLGVVTQVRWVPAGVRGPTRGALGHGNGPRHGSDAGSGLLERRPGGLFGSSGRAVEEGRAPVKEKPAPSAGPPEPRVL